MKTNRLFITVMMAAIFSCGNMLAQNAQAPNQKKETQLLNNVRKCRSTGCRNL